MRRFVSALSCVLLVALSSSALAGDVPQPVKKPKDRTGAVITSPTEDPGPAPAAQPAPETGKTDTGTTAPQAEPTLTRSSGKVTKAAAEPPKPAPAASPAAVPPPAASAPPNKVAPPPLPTEWSEAEIKDAKVRCAELLKGIDAVSIPEPSFRSGMCGAPAAVRLISIGKNPQVALDPPAILTCEMVRALHTWMAQKVQPLAKAHLNSEIIKIETMSDYSCRNAYGRTKNKLSEHGHANAQQAYVLEHWGPIQREIAERIAAEKKAAEKAARDKALAAATPPTGSTTTAQAPAILKQTITDGAPAQGTATAAAAPSPAAATSTALGYQPSRLGGPDGKGTSAASRTQAFLHAAHDAACEIFGTTLGPEANNDHRNHFHVDMAPRTATKICD
jgi:hypothetical protein